MSMMNCFGLKYDLIEIFPIIDIFFHSRFESKRYSESEQEFLTRDSQSGNLNNFCIKNQGIIFCEGEGVGRYF